MQIQINDTIYPIEITYKNNKNMYLRIKDGPKIEITAPNRTPEKAIKKFIESNIYTDEFKNRKSYKNSFN